MLVFPKPRNTESVRSTVTTILKPPMLKSGRFPRPKHPRNIRDLQCMSKQNIYHAGIASTMTMQQCWLKQGTRFLSTFFSNIET